MAPNWYDPPPIEDVDPNSPLRDFRSPDANNLWIFHVLSLERVATRGRTAGESAPDANKMVAILAERRWIEKPREGSKAATLHQLGQRVRRYAYIVQNKDKIQLGKYGSSGLIDHVFWCWCCHYWYKLEHPDHDPGQSKIVPEEEIELPDTYEEVKVLLDKERKERLGSDLQAKKIKELEAIIQQLEKRNQALTNTVDLATKANEELMQKIAESENGLSDSHSTETTQTTIHQLREEVKSQKVSNKKKDNEIQEQKENSRMLQTQVSSLTNCMQNVTSTIQKMEEERGSLQEKYKLKLEKLNEEHEEALEELRLGREKAMTIVDEQLMTIEEQSTKMEEQSKRISKLEGKVQKLRDRIRTLIMQQEPIIKVEDTDEGNPRKRKVSPAKTNASDDTASKAQKT